MDEITSGTLTQYLHNVRKTPLLSKSEELRVSRLAARGDESAINTMIESNLRLVINIAKRYKTTAMTLMDIIQEGNIGLMKAVNKFDPELGNRFATYAGLWVREAIQVAIIYKEKIIRKPTNVAKTYNALLKRLSESSRGFDRALTHSEIADRLNVSVCELNSAIASQDYHMSSYEVSDSTRRTMEEDFTYGNGSQGINDYDDPLQKFTRDDASQDILRLSKVLSCREFDILSMRYGLCYSAKKTLQQAGDTVGLSREGVRQIEIAALQKMRDAAQAEMI